MGLPGGVPGRLIGSPSRKLRYVTLPTRWSGRGETPTGMGWSQDRRARFSGRVADRPTLPEISLPAQADGARVSDRIAVLADNVDVFWSTDNHAGQPRMSPLAAVALARSRVWGIVHVSCRDRNRLALQSQVVGAAALVVVAVLCIRVIRWLVSNMWAT